MGRGSTALLDQHRQPPPPECIAVAAGMRVAAAWVAARKAEVRAADVVVVAVQVEAVQAVLRNRAKMFDNQQRQGEEYAEGQAQSLKRKCGRGLPEIWLLASSKDMSSRPMACCAPIVFPGCG